MLLWTTLYSLGLLNESRDFAVRFELTRLFVALPLAVAGMMQTGLIDAELLGPVATAAAVYALISAAVLRVAARQDAEILA